MVYNPVSDVDIVSDLQNTQLHAYTPEIIFLYGFSCSSNFHPSFSRIKESNYIGKVIGIEAIQK